MKEKLFILILFSHFIQASTEPLLKQKTAHYESAAAAAACASVPQTIKCDNKSKDDQAQSKLKATLNTKLVIIPSYGSRFTERQYIFEVSPQKRWVINADYFEDTSPLSSVQYNRLVYCREFRNDSSLTISFREINSIQDTSLSLTFYREWHGGCSRKEVFLSFTPDEKCVIIKFKKSRYSTFSTSFLMTLKDNKDELDFGNDNLYFSPNFKYLFSERACDSKFYVEIFSIENFLLKNKQLKEGFFKALPEKISSSPDKRWNVWVDEGYFPKDKDWHICIWDLNNGKEPIKKAGEKILKLSNKYLTYKHKKKIKVYSLLDKMVITELSADNNAQLSEAELDARAAEKRNESCCIIM